MTDPIVDAVCAKLQSRSAVGIKKYGTTLANNAATVKEKLIHAQEEVMDLANYLEWLLQEKEMPTPMTIEMEADARQAARDNFNYADANNLRMDDLGENTKKTIRSALQPPRDNPIEPISFVCWEENGVRLKTRHGEFIVTTPTQGPRVLVVSGLDEAIFVVKEYLEGMKNKPTLNSRTIGPIYDNFHKELLKIHTAARAYAELQKGV